MKNKLTKKKSLTLFDVLNGIFMVLMIAIIVYPLYYTVIASLSEPNAVAGGKIIWKPVGFTLESYKYVFQYKPIWTGYMNSIIYTLFGTLFALCLTIPTAYVMSKRYLPHKGLFALFFMISMYFGGGMVPMYLQVKKLGLIDTRSVLIVLGGLSVYNILSSTPPCTTKA